MDGNTQAKLERQRAFWRRENHDRPVIGFTGSYFPTDTARMLRQAGPAPAPRRGPHLTPQDVRVEAFVEDCEAQYAAWRDCTGDLFWTASPLPGFFRWLCGALGQPLSIRSENIWGEPFLADYAQFGALAPRVGNPWVEALWRLTDALAARSGGRYPVAVAALLGPLSVLAELRSPTQLAADLYDHPDGVQEAMRLLTEWWVRLVSEHFRHLPQWHGGYTSSTRYLWAPGHIVEFDEDSSFMFSPRTHQRFVMPHHRELVRHLDYAFIHLHSTQLHTLDNLLELAPGPSRGLAAIELTPDYGASIPDLIPAIAKVQAKKPVIVHGYLTAEEMRLVMERVPPEGVCLMSRRDTPEEARRLQEQVLG